MLAEFDEHQVIYLSADLHIESLRYTGGGEVYLKIAEPCAILTQRFRSAYPEVLAAFFWPTKDTPPEKATEYIQIF
jgi:hypothetical protein